MSKRVTACDFVDYAWHLPYLRFYTFWNNRVILVLKLVRVVLQIIVVCYSFFYCFTVMSCHTREYQRKCQRMLETLRGWYVIILRKKKK